MPQAGSSTESLKPSGVAFDHGGNSEQLRYGGIRAGLCSPVNEMLKWPIMCGKPVQASAIDGGQVQARRLLPHRLPKPFVEARPNRQDRHLVPRPEADCPSYNRDSQSQVRMNPP